MQKYILTQTGLDDLKREYDNLVNLKRPEAVKRVAIAREQGDLSENSEYAAAREELSMLEGRILELEDIIHNVKIISNQHSKTQIDIGCRVTLHIDSRKDIFTIVGEWEADPKEKKISHSSPLGRALLGKRIGDVIEVEAPVGKLQYQVVDIE